MCERQAARQAVGAEIEMTCAESVFDYMEERHGGVMHPVSFHFCQAVLVKMTRRENEGPALQRQRENTKV